MRTWARLRDLISFLLTGGDEAHARNRYRGNGEQLWSAPQLSPTWMLDEFHRTLDDEPGRGNAPLRITLHQEEHDELIEALHMCHGDEEIDGAATQDGLEHLARELADVVYIAYGTAHAFDIDLDAAMREIHRAAMTKLNPPGGRVVREDGKILKPPGFVPPDMREAVR